MIFEYLYLIGVPIWIMIGLFLTGLYKDDSFVEFFFWSAIIWPIIIAVSIITIPFVLSWYIGHRLHKNR